ncbi:MAG TPA: UDP-N-acetylmuramate dehydrogenase [Acidimicrobiales bacterium]
MSVPDHLVAALEAELGAAVHRDAPLGARTTYRVGGTASLLVEVGSVTELVALAGVTATTDESVPVVVVGRGSNLLVADAGFDGIAVVLGEELGAIEVEGTLLTAGGAASLPVVARRSAAVGLAGFEWAVGVPGSVGGAVRMNAGGHGSDMAATLRRVRVVDLRTGEDGWVTVSDLDLGYRRSCLGPHQVVAAAELVLARGDRATSEAELGEIVRWRREHQPGGTNAGSVFTNPPGDSAGRLLDEAGAKGRRVGTAEVSAKHANFIQADEGGSADDVAALMAELRALVRARAGIDLHAETHLLGFAPDQAAAAGARLLTGLEGIAPRDPRSGVEG